MREAWPLLVVLALVSCGGSAAGPSAGAPAVATPAPCTTLPPADPTLALPTDLPAVPEGVLFDGFEQGKTKVLFSRVTGDDFVAVRDAYVAALEDAGYDVVGTDQEAVEAEAQFDGPHEGTLQVQRLCGDQLQVRYRLLS